MLPSTFSLAVPMHFICSIDLTLQGNCSWLQFREEQQAYTFSSPKLFIQGDNAHLHLVNPYVWASSSSHLKLLGFKGSVEASNLNR